ncbi:MAG: hypothetical protein BGO76_01785 [Caedibacter sp. 38-128]|nr:hypothetical protein [Holosporales bacterium]OJX05145.1 MAG: hypothetical protein BGO76_01785 [Caedibacter sp. 38-128]
MHKLATIIVGMMLTASKVTYSSHLTEQDEKRVSPKFQVHDAHLLLESDNIFQAPSKEIDEATDKLSTFKISESHQQDSEELKEEEGKALNASNFTSEGLTSEPRDVVNSEKFFGFYSPKHHPEKPTPQLPKFHILTVAHSVDMSSSDEETEEDARVRKEIKLTPLPSLEERYKVPQEELESLGSGIGKAFSGWKSCVIKASEFVHHYEIRPQATTFSARDQVDADKGIDEYYDYYDILLNLRINTPSEFKNYNFLPKGFIIEAQPVRYNNGWELVDYDSCPVRVWEYCPERLMGQIEATWTKGYTCLASSSAGLTANLLTGGPSVSASGTASASYTSTFSFKRTIPDMDIIPMTEFNNVGWEITFNRLTSKPEQGQGFCSDRAINIGNFRWVWKVNRKIASNNLYSGEGPQDKGIFYFKVNLFVRFSLVDPREKATTNFLHVFENNNGELGQIFGLKIPKLQEE